MRRKNSPLILKYLLVPLVLWTAIVWTAFMWNQGVLERNTMTLALDRAKAFFRIIQTHRAWNARHGGVYVPVTDKTRPNPYLSFDPTRDIITDTGVKYTKINPAYMTRLVAEIAKKEEGAIFHITSLRPVRPENRADEWETSALREFEQGVSEKLELTNMEGQEFFRYMAPLKTKKACLKCHARHGYKEGDIRGGISISMPAKTFISIEKAQSLNIGTHYLIAYMIGSLAILLYQQRVRKEAQAAQTAIEQKETLIKEIHHRVKNNMQIITSLLSMQSGMTDNSEAKEMFEVCSSRVRSMALVHEKLYGSRDLGNVDARVYFRSLIDEIMSLSGPSNGVRAEIKIDEVSLSMRTSIPCGLIINELVTNAIKHAFGPEGGTINVELQDLGDGSIFLSVADNGRGLQEDPESLKDGDTLGLRLVHILVKQLNGTLKTTSDNGLRFEISFRAG